MRSNLIAGALAGFLAALLGWSGAAQALPKAAHAYSLNGTYADLVSGEAQTLGAAMNHASLNMANALGAWLGGLVIAAGYGYRAPALVGAALSVAGIGVLVWSAAVDRRSTPS